MEPTSADRHCIALQREKLFGANDGPCQYRKSIRTVIGGKEGRHGGYLCALRCFSSGTAMLN
jgi:hypothetical protein